MSLLIDALGVFNQGLTKSRIINVSPSKSLAVVDPNKNPGMENIPQNWRMKWMGPGGPFTTVSNTEYERQKSFETIEPRGFQYPPNVNTTLVPRAAYKLMLFTDLYMFANATPEVAMCIRLILSELKSFVPAIKDSNGNVVTDSPYQWMVTKPDGYYPHQIWLTTFIKNKLMYDAAAAFLRRGAKDRIVSSRAIDGSTIFVIIDDLARAPEPPYPAFQQYIWGTPRDMFTTSQLWYKPSNRDTQSPYGKTVVEDNMPAVALLQNLWFYEAQKYIVGNMPDAVFVLPPGFGTGDKADAILDFEDAWNDRMRGNNNERPNSARFMPNGTTMLVAKELTFNQASYDAATNAIRLGFGIPQSEVGETPAGGLGGSGYENVMVDKFYLQGLSPNLRYAEGHFNDIIEMNGDKDRWFFAYDFPQQTIDPEKEEAKWSNRFTCGGITRDEYRQGINLKPLGGEEGNFMVTPGQKNDDSSGISISKPSSITVKKMIKVRKLQKKLPGIDGIDLSQAADIAEKYNIKVDDMQQFTMGLNEEMEHASDNDIETIAEIVMDHLTEDGDYYDKLKSAMSKADLQKLIGVDPDDDQYFGAPVENPDEVLMPHEGANDSYVVSIGGDNLKSRPAVWKPKTGEKESLVAWVGGDLYRRAEAAYLIDRELAPDHNSYLVPVAYMTEIGGVPGSIQMYVQKRQGRKMVDEYDHNWIEQAAVFDYIIGQMDREKNNWLTHSFDRKRPVLIDNDCSFPVNNSQKVHSQFTDAMRGEKLSKRILDSVYLLIGNRAIWEDIASCLNNEVAAENAKSRANEIYNQKTIPTTWVKVKGGLEVKSHSTVEVESQSPVDVIDPVSVESDSTVDVLNKANKKDDKQTPGKDEIKEFMQGLSGIRK